MSKINERSLLAGGISGMISQTVTWPMEYIKTLKQLNKNKSIKTSQIVLNEIKKKGILIPFFLLKF